MCILDTTETIISDKLDSGPAIPSFGIFFSIAFSRLFRKKYMKIAVFKIDKTALNNLMRNKLRAV